MPKRLIAMFVTSAALVMTLAATASAQHARGGAVGRGAGPGRVGVGVLPSRTYRVAPFAIHPYRYGTRVSVFLGYGYGWGYPYGHYGWYGPGYGYYGWSYPYGPYGYPYGYYSAYGYGYAGHPTGSIRIVDAPKEAQVFADGYYAGIVDDFDGSFHRLDLEPGPHRIEVRAEGLQPLVVNVNVDPYRTITVHARLHQ